MIKSTLFALALIFLPRLNVFAAKNAVVIALRAGDQQLSDTNRLYCETLIRLLRKSGFRKSDITVFFEGGNNNFPGGKEVSKDNILEKLNNLKKSLKKNDSLWIFLFGHANLNRRGLSLATKGRRLRGKALGDILDQLPCRQFVFCLNRQSFPLMRILCDRSDRAVFVATNDVNQLNPPLLPKFLLEVWTENPAVSLSNVFKKGADLTAKFYNDNGIAIPETPQMFDGKTIVNYPFREKPDSTLCGVSLVNADAVAMAASKIGKRETIAASTTVSEKDKPLDFSEFDDLNVSKNDSAEFADIPPLKPATNETKKAIALAANLAEKHIGYNAICVRDDIQYTVNTDHSTGSVRNQAFYLLKDVASENYGGILMRDSPPDYELTIENARIIYPDGSYREITDNKVSDAFRHIRYHQLKFPGAKALCLIQFTLKYSSAPKTQLRDFNKEFILQRKIPTISSKLTVRVPPKQYFRYKLYHSDATPMKSEGEYSKITSFDLGELPAMEPLPYDPPFRDCVIRLQLSSMRNWTEFRKWVARIMDDSDEVDEKTADLARKIAKSAESDVQKLKALYEFICDFRYESTPIGARAFRPRLPSEVCGTRYGDCKDKANTLVALARVLGIKGYIALLNRQSTTDPDFPGWQFNHAVAFFPKLKGFPNGIWCDATDGSTPFASLPPGDIGRDGFVLLDKGYEFRKVTLPMCNANSLTEKINMRMRKDNKASAELEIKATGLSDYYLRQRLKRAAPLQQTSIVQTILNRSLTGMSITKLEISPLGDLSVPLLIQAECVSDNASLSVSDIRPPRDFWNPVSMPVRNRPLQLNDNQPFSVSQSLTIRGISPLSKEFEQKGEYCDTVVVFSSEAGAFRRDVKIKISKPLIPANDYHEFRKQIIQWYSNMRRDHE
ncbi:MAG: transglutaminase domain-containing protein [Kiritimatiellaeota bacterium]|nr:transglutaminase domain-containing protein [Kiritimatiellota bacterium]